MSDIIKVAANLALGRYLYDLYEIVETQKSISSGRLEAYLDVAHELMKLDCIKIREERLSSPPTDYS